MYRGWLWSELTAPSIDDQLRPKTGRRYIVVGGVRCPFLSMKCTDEALGRIPGCMDHFAAAQTRRRPHGFRVRTMTNTIAPPCIMFQSLLVILAGDYGAAPRRMNVLSSEESSLDPAAELA